MLFIYLFSLSQNRVMSNSLLHRAEESKCAPPHPGMQAVGDFIKKKKKLLTWCVQVLRSPKEAFAAAMQSWRERCEKCVCLQGDYIEK